MNPLSHFVRRIAAPVALVSATLSLAGCEAIKRHEVPDATTTQLEASTPTTPTASPTNTTEMMPAPVGTPTTGTAAKLTGQTDSGVVIAKGDAGADAGKPPAKKSR